MPKRVYNVKKADCLAQPDKYVWVVGEGCFEKPKASSSSPKMSLKKNKSKKADCQPPKRWIVGQGCFDVKIKPLINPVRPDSVEQLVQDMIAFDYYSTFDDNIQYARRAMEQQRGFYANIESMTQKEKDKAHQRIVEGIKARSDLRASQKSDFIYHVNNSFQKPNIKGVTF